VGLIAHQAVGVHLPAQMPPPVSNEHPRLPTNSVLVASRVSAYSIRLIAGVVAAITEGEPGVESERASDNTVG
jgi:hypothetical protein